MLEVFIAAIFIQRLVYFDLCGAKVVLFFDICKKMANFLLGELAPSTKLVAGGKFPNTMGGGDGQRFSRYYLEAWMREPMMKPRRVV